MAKEATAPKTPKTDEEKEAIIEIFIAIMLGITALLTAWASWEGSLHGGNQATNYTKSTNLAAEGNSLWNEQSQYLQQDVQIWNEINSISIDMAFAEDKGDAEEVERLQYKLDQVYENVSPEYYDAIMWALDQEEYATPFEMEGYVDSYYEEARALIAEGDEALEQGQKDNTNGDKLGLVTVIYSVVLFLLGIVNTFKNLKNKYVVIGIALVGFVLATVFMFTIPLPTGFNIVSYFSGS